MTNETDPNPQAPQAGAVRFPFTMPICPECGKAALLKHHCNQKTCPIQWCPECGFLVDPKRGRRAPQVNLQVPTEWLKKQPPKPPPKSKDK